MAISLTDVGKRIGVVLVDRGMNYEQLGKAVGISPDQIRRYVDGACDMKLTTAIAIADALNIGLEELACRSDYVVSA